MLEKAIAIAASAHAGQKDKGGHPYIFHPLRVMLAVEGETAQTAAVLHDTIEDTAVTFSSLEEAGFSPEVLSLVDCLTRRQGETYQNYISRIGENPAACRIKLADIADNLDPRRLPSLTPSDKKRMEKYQKAQTYLLSKLDSL